MANSTTTMTFRIDTKTKEQLGELAKITDRSKSYLAACAIKTFIDMNTWQIEGIQKAVNEADNGKTVFIEHERVEDWLMSWGTSDEEEPPL